MAFIEQLRCEWLLQRRRPYVWFCVAAFFLVAFFDTVQIGWQAEGGQWVNGAALISHRAIMYSLMGVIAIAGVVVEPFARDRLTSTQELVLSTPASRWTLGLARYLVTIAIVAFATLMIAPGMMLATLVPGIPPELIGPFEWRYYAAAFGYFLLPNFVLVAAAVFAVASRWESRALGYGASVAALAAWITTRMLLGRDVLRQEVFATYAILDPFGSIASIEFTIGRTVAQNNELFPPLAGTLLANRVLWMAIAFGLVSLGVAATPTRPRGFGARSRNRPRIEAPTTVAPHSEDQPADASRVSSKEPSAWIAAAAEFWTTLRWECLVLWRQPMTKVCLGAVAFTLWWSAASAVTHQFSLPTTDLLVHNTAYYFDKILVLAIVWIAGELLWRDSTLKTAEVIDSLPTSDTLRFLAKTATLVVVVVVFWLLSIGVNMLYQAARGYFRFEPALYLTDSFVFKAPFYVWFALLAISMQAVVRQRYIALALTMLVYLAEVLLDAVNVHHPMFRFGRVSHVWYSLMDGYGHFWQPHRWMLLYWTLGSAAVWLLGWASVWRGVNPPSAVRLWRRRFLGRTSTRIALACVAAFSVVAAYVWHESTVAAPWPPLDADRIKAEIETKYGPAWRGKAQPRIVSIRGELDLYPAERRFVLDGVYTIENQHERPIRDILVPATPGLDVDVVSFETGAERVDHDDKLNLSHYRLSEALPAGERITMSFRTSSRPPDGFAVHSATDNVPHVGRVEVIGNGTSLLNLRMMPAVGYTDRVEHKPAWKRRKYGLPEEWTPPEGEDARRQGHGTLHLGWVESINMTIRTAADQTALHAGALVREWTEPDGRRGFHYRVDRPSRGWSQVISGRYDKRVFRSSGMPDVEVYYDPQHEPSVRPFGEALRAAIEYFASRYGPPPFETFRLAEQSLHYDGFGSRGGLAFSSEVLGWKSDFAASGGQDIKRMAALMVAMGWWGDQVIPANTAGAKVVHAGLPYWTAALYLSQTRPAEVDRRLRLQEAITLFRGRSEMTDLEAPFVEEFKDSTMIRNKGSFHFLYLADLIGPEQLEAILADFLDNCRYRPAPYPSARELVDRLEQGVPAEHRPLVSQMFERVNTWRLSVNDATASPVKGGRWRLRATIDAHQFETTGWGKEREVDVDFPISIAVFSGGVSKTDETVWTERRRLQSGPNEIELLLGAKPTRVGVDPDLLLPDPNPHDNVRPVR